MKEFKVIFLWILIEGQCLQRKDGDYNSAIIRSMSSSAMLGWKEWLDKVKCAFFSASRSQSVGDQHPTGHFERTKVRNR